MADPVQVKICGLTRREDVLTADAAGADYVGVVVTPGFGRSVSPDEAAALVAGTTAVPVAVMVDQDLHAAVDAALTMGAGVVQLHGEESPGMLAELRTRGPWRIWKAVRVRSPEELLLAAARYGEVVDALLVEGWKEGVVGGGGARADLDLLEGARDRLPAGLRVVLAGGLTPDTVFNAVGRFRPDVVDVSSGVEEAPGIKSPELVRRFIQEARKGPAPERAQRP